LDDLAGIVMGETQEVGRIGLAAADGAASSRPLCLLDAEAGQAQIYVVTVCLYQAVFHVTIAKCGKVASHAHSLSE